MLNVLDEVRVDRELPFVLEVAAPLPKGDRGDFLIEKLTELGVTTFVPLRTNRSVVEPRETKLDRLRQRVIEASKQCGRNVLMDVRALVDWDTYCVIPGHDTTRLLAHTGPARNPDGPETEGNVQVAVGPEGGFTDDEVAAGVAAGWRLFSLGPRVLRVETAAVVIAGWLATNSVGSEGERPGEPTQ